jgi:hypothetical protein
MALLLRGLTECPLCGEVIQKEDDVVMFSPGVYDTADPLHIFNDASFHMACFDAHPLGEAAELRWGQGGYGRSKPRAERPAPGQEPD